MDQTFFLFSCIVLLSFTTEAFSGFGSIVIAVTLGSHLYALDELLPVLVPLNLVLSSYMVIRHRGHINRPLLLYRILPLMLAGVAVGVIVFATAPGEVLKRVFGGMVVLLSMRELWNLSREGGGNHGKPVNRLAGNTGIVGAGIIHGIYASGGPLLVYVLGRSGLTKGGFRSTLSTVWLVLNAVLAVIYLFAGKITGPVVDRLLMLLPVVVVAIVLGEWSHHRIPEHPFRVSIFLLLLGAGLSILM